MSVGNQAATGIKGYSREFSQSGAQASIPKKLALKRMTRNDPSRCEMSRRAGGHNMRKFYPLPAQKRIKKPATRQVWVVGLIMIACWEIPPQLLGAYAIAIRSAFPVNAAV